jgi:hypothetical protein
MPKPDITFEIIKNNVSEKEMTIEMSNSQLVVIRYGKDGQSPHAAAIEFIESYNKKAHPDPAVNAYYSTLTNAEII